MKARTSAPSAEEPRVDLNLVLATIVAMGDGYDLLKQDFTKKTGIPPSEKEFKDEVYKRLRAAYKEFHHIADKACDSQKKTPLMYAAQMRQPYTIEWLFDSSEHRFHAPHPELHDNEGNTAITHAVAFEDSDKYEEKSEEKISDKLAYQRTCITLIDSKTRLGDESQSCFLQLEALKKTAVEKGNLWFVGYFLKQKQYEDISGRFIRSAMMEAMLNAIVHRQQDIVEAFSVSDLFQYDFVKDSNFAFQLSDRVLDLYSTGYLSNIEAIQMIGCLMPYLSNFCLQNYPDSSSHKNLIKFILVSNNNDVAFKDLLSLIYVNDCLAFNSDYVLKLIRIILYYNESWQMELSQTKKMISLAIKHLFVFHKDRDKNQLNINRLLLFALKTEDKEFLTICANLAPAAELRAFCVKAMQQGMLHLIKHLKTAQEFLISPGEIEGEIRANIAEQQPQEQQDEVEEDQAEDEVESEAEAIDEVEENPLGEGQIANLNSEPQEEIAAVMPNSAVILDESQPGAGAPESVEPQVDAASPIAAPTAYLNPSAEESKSEPVPKLNVTSSGAATADDSFFVAQRRKLAADKYKKAASAAQESQEKKPLVFS